MLKDLATWFYAAIVIGVYGYYAFRAEAKPLASIWFIIKTTGIFCLLHYIWNWLDVHKRWGPWGVSEPKSHFNFVMLTSWIVLLYTLGDFARIDFYGLDLTGAFKNGRILSWELPEKYHFIKSNSVAEDWFWGLLCFYWMDFMRYWAHRLGHESTFLYKTFPFSHAHHHNQIFLNPLVYKMSPILHLAAVGSYVPAILMGAIGLHRASTIAWACTVFPTITQHLGFDPLPFITRANHYYFFGAIPWIPLYHCYHHNPFVKDGCYGNTTVLFDYIFGTVQPECVYHIENGRPMEKIRERMQDPEKLDKILQSMYYVDKDPKNRIDLNNPEDFESYKKNLSLFSG
jgi:sterol desaturase/sphingolipid hydroxylase (fatty acid hydroxylase superfamily)